MRSTGSGKVRGHSSGLGVQEPIAVGSGCKRNRAPISGGPEIWYLAFTIYDCGSRRGESRMSKWQIIDSQSRPFVGACVSGKVERS